MERKAAVGGWSGYRGAVILVGGCASMVANQPWKEASSSKVAVEKGAAAGSAGSRACDMVANKGDRRIYNVWQKAVKEGERKVKQTESRGGGKFVLALCT